MLTHQGTKELETKRLLLRRAVLTDAEAMYHNWASDPEVTKYLTWPAHSSVDVSKTVIESWLKGYQKQDYYQWMIVPKELGEPIGSIAVVYIHEKAELAEIGYCIGKNWWHQGIMTEALSTVLHFLFLEVGFNRIQAQHDTSNPHSGQVMAKCGMHYEFTAKDYGWNNQGICDITCYRLLRREYEQQHSLDLAGE